MWMWYDYCMVIHMWYEVVKTPSSLSACPLKFGDVFKLGTYVGVNLLRLEKLDGTMIYIDPEMYRNMNMFGFIEPANKTIQTLYGVK